MRENAGQNLVSFRVEERFRDQWIDRGLSYIGAEQADLDGEFSDCAQNLLACAKLVMRPSEKIFILPDQTTK
jgi:hypothetical protein